MSSEYTQAILLTHKPQVLPYYPETRNFPQHSLLKKHQNKRTLCWRLVFDGGQDGGTAGRTQHGCPTLGHQHIKELQWGSPCWSVWNEDNGTEIGRMRNHVWIFSFNSRYWGPCEFGEKSDKKALLEVFYYLLRRIEVVSLPFSSHLTLA